MLVRFSPEGPAFPDSLIDDFLAGDVVFLCGAGVSAPQLPTFSEMVKVCFTNLNVEVSASEIAAFAAGRFEEVLGSLSRGVVNSLDVLKVVVDQLRLPSDANLRNHETLLRLSRDLENRPTIVTTNFDTLLEHSLLKECAVEQIPKISFAGQDLPLPGSPSFSGIIHLHGRIDDAALNLSQTPLVLTSADYGDAYMRSGWASRFLFDLCRSKTLVLVGYSAGDAPVRYFLNVLAADRQRFHDLKPVYALDAFGSQARWETLAVTPIVYQKVPDPNNGNKFGHLALWRDLVQLAELVESPRKAQRRLAEELLSKSLAELTPPELAMITWLFKSNQVLWDIVIKEVKDPAWFDFFKEHQFLQTNHAAHIIANWAFLAPQSLSRFNVVVKWLEALGDPLISAISMKLGQAAPTLDRLWLRAWRLLSQFRARPKEESFFASPYQLVERLSSSGFLLQVDVMMAIDLLTPRLEIRESFSSRGESIAPDSVKFLQQIFSADLSLAHPAINDERLIFSIVDSLKQHHDPLFVLEIATAKLRECVGIARDFELIGEGYDRCSSGVPSVERHAQNAYYDGLAQLVQLITDLWSVAVAVNPKAACTVAEQWRQLPGALGNRMWLHALRNEKAFSPNESVQALRTLNLDGFWGIQRELAFVLKERSGGASAYILKSLERRILSEGLSYYARYKVEEGQIDWRPQARDRDVWLLLNMLKIAKVITSTAAQELQAIIERQPHLERGVVEEDFFGSYSTGLYRVEPETQPLIDATPDVRLLRAQEAIQSGYIERRQGWSAYCVLDPEGAARALMSAPRDAANAALWDGMIVALAEPQINDDGLRMRLIVELFKSLEDAKAPFLCLIVNQMSYLYRRAPRLQEASIAKWWPRLLALAVEHDKTPFTASGHVYSDAMSTAAGSLTLSLLEDCKVHHDSGKKLGSDQLVLLATAAQGCGRQGTMARAILTMAVDFLVSAKAVESVNMLKRCMKSETDEGAALLNLLVVDSPLSPKSTKTFKPELLKGLGQFREKGASAARAASKLLRPGLSLINKDDNSRGWGITLSQIANTLQKGSPELRSGAAAVLARWVQQASPDRLDPAVFWDKQVQPLIANIWPRHRNLHTLEVGRSFALLAIHTGSAFPNALAHLLPYIDGSEGNNMHIHSIQQSQVPVAFPLETLILLWRMYGQSRKNEVYGLAPILDRIVEANPSLERDRRLQTLAHRAATGY